MRVLLDTTRLADAPGGVATYLRRIVPALRAQGVEVVEARRPRARGGGGLRSARNLVLDRLWTDVELPRRARAARADLIHHPLPAHAAGTPLPQVVTVQDLAYERLPQHFDRRWRAVARREHRHAARRAAAILVPSEATRADVRSRWERDAILAPYGPGELAPVDSPGDRHFLYVGDDEPRKNLAVLRAAHARAGAPLPLVVAGRAQRTHADLAPLLRDAAALVLPSLHEGFGLPALEAMAAGVPVVASRAPGLAELCEGAARMVDPRDPEDLARALTELAADAALRARLSAAGRARAGKFSWATCAAAHVAAYALAVG